MMCHQCHVYNKEEKDEMKTNHNLKLKKDQDQKQKGTHNLDPSTITITTKPMIDAYNGR